MTRHPHPRRRAAPGRPRPLRGRGGARPLAAAAAARGLRRPGRGQGSSSASSSRRPAPAARRSTTCCSPARPGSARRRWRRSWPTSSTSPFVSTAGPALERKGDVAIYLSSLEPRSVFFVDEIHRLPRALEETFYPAMEDRRLPITVGQGAGARVVNLDLPPFTLIGATTRAGLLTTPLRDRFGVAHRLELYDPAELGQIVRRSAGILDVEIDTAGAEAIAARSRGTPRVANRLLKRVRDFAEVRGAGTIDAGVATEALELLEVDRARPRPARPRDPARDLREVRRRAGRPVDARGGRQRGAGHDRGRLRALPAPAGPDHAHAARPRRHAGGLCAPRPRAADRRRAPLLTRPLVSAFRAELHLSQLR